MELGISSKAVDAVIVRTTVIVSRITIMKHCFAEDIILPFQSGIMGELARARYNLDRHLW